MRKLLHLHDAGSWQTHKCYENTDSKSNLTIKISQWLSIMKIAKYFISFKAPTKIMKTEQALKSPSSYKKFLKMYLPELGALMGHFHYRLNQIVNHTRCPQDVWFMPYKSHSKGELKWLQHQDIITLLGVGETSECIQVCIRIESQWKGQIMPISSGLNQSLLRLIHRGPTLNDIFPKLNNAHLL